MKSTDIVGITFANMVSNRGIFNGNVNISLAAFQFTPNDDNAVDPDPVIVCRLRLDKSCAQQLHETLGDLLVLIEKAEAEAAEGTPAVNGADTKPTPAPKPN